jgi:hypothetical protein
MTRAEYRRRCYLAAFAMTGASYLVADALAAFLAGGLA